MTHSTTRLQSDIKDAVDDIRRGLVPNFPSPAIFEGVMKILTDEEKRTFGAAKAEIYEESRKFHAERETTKEEGRILYRLLQERYGEERAKWFHDDDPEVIEVKAEIA